MEIDRVLDIKNQWNLENTGIWFKTQKVIAGSTADNTGYRLYFGNPEADNPKENPNNVFEIYDDFSNGLNSWNIISGIWSVDNNSLKTNSSDAYIINTTNSLNYNVTEVPWKFSKN